MLLIRPRCLLRNYQHRRLYSTPSSSTSGIGFDPKSTILNVPPRAQIYRFGDSNATTTPALHFEANESANQDEEEGWRIREGEAWAVVGAGTGAGKAALFQTLLGHLRISPNPTLPHGLFPFLAARSLDPYTSVSLVSFAHRTRGATSGGGNDFYDYSARYGYVREEDRVTLRQSMDLPPEGQISATRVQDMKLDLLHEMGLTPFLDVPVIALSNGQTRKARIVKAVCKVPQTELLFLDEPLTGVDAKTRPSLLKLLWSFHMNRDPRLILGLRAQDAIPEWITHIALVEDGHGGSIRVGNKDEMQHRITSHIPTPTTSSNKTHGKLMNVANDAHSSHQPIIEMTNVDVAYGPRQVLQSISWSIHPGSKWHLSGANGSGKTTLLSLFTGEHPQSYSLLSKLKLFGLPRNKIATMELKEKVGVASMEVFDAFPRRAGVSVDDVIRMGFKGTFFRIKREDSEVGEDVRRRWEWEDKKVEEVVLALGPRTWILPSEESTLEDEVQSDEAFLARDFISLSQAEQSVVLLMRALVGRPRLLMLDEVWAGMSAGMVSAVKRYLRGESEMDGGGLGDDQTVIVVSHWVEEVPWGVEDGLRTFKLEDGKGSEVDNL